MKTIQTGPVFYVYEHWRPDLDVCFYVGKTIEKLRDSHLGNVAAPNTRAKMSASQSKRWENPDLHLAVSSKAKMLWADPEYRAKQAAARKARVKSS